MNKTTIVPAPFRIRGKVGQAYEGPKEIIGKWYFTIWVSAFGSGDPKDDESFGPFGPWETEKVALKELRRATQLVSETLEKKMTGNKKPSGVYLDMKSNLYRRWDGKGEN